MQNFTYCVPTKVIFGKGTIPGIGKEIAARNLKKILIVGYSKDFDYFKQIYPQILQSFKDNGIEHFELFDIKPNPLLSKAKEGIALAKREGIQGVLAIGGGSVIDTAKCIALGALYDGDVWDFYEKKIVADKALPVFTILTISGTGTENNGNSVITALPVFAGISAAEGIVIR